MKKIGFIGAMSPSLMMALQYSSAFKGAELIEVTQDQADEDEQKIATIGYPIIDELRPTFRIDSKTGSNKSDRKRNRKNRWR